MIEMLPINERLISDNKRKSAELYSGNGKITVSAVWGGEYAVTQVNAVTDEEAQFNSLIDNLNRQCIALKNGFDNIPAVGFDFGAYLIALAYGCKMVKLNGIVSSEPLFQSISQAQSFERKTNIYEHGLYPLITERIMKFQKLFPAAIITLPDNQSPIDVFTSILHSEEAIYAMFDYPDEVHRLLNIITDSIIETARHFQRITQNFAGFAPNGYHGMHVSDDNAAFLSPDVYNEFAAPYIEKLSEEFDGILFHCCLGYEQNLESMKKIRGFLGYDAHPDYNNMSKILNPTSRKWVWELFNYPWSKRENRGYSDEEMIFKAIEESEGICGIKITVFDYKMEEAVRLAYNVKNYAVKMGRM